MLTEAAKYAVSGAASGWATAQTDAVIHNRSLDTSDTIFSAVLGGSMAYAGYKTAEAVTRNNARTVVEETNAKIKATEDPVKENTGNTSSKNSSQNNGGSKNSGKNNANGRQTPLEENANAAKSGAKTDSCPLSGGSKDVKASLWERMTTKTANVKDLHPNPLDEFSNPKIGPNESAVSKYIREIITEGTITEPIEVQKLASGGYEIVNGHHRWLAAIKVGLQKVPIEIVNYEN